MFLGGYYVFPGGRRDEEDFSKAALKRMFSKNLKAKAGEVDSKEPEAKRLGCYAAAIREAFEEAGVLIACGKEGREIKPHPGLDAELAAMRSRIHGGEISFLKMLSELDLFYDLDRLSWFAHWITPEFSPRRFDTQFFIAEIPAGRKPKGFAGEVDEEIWVKPARALARWQAGELPMIPPTAASLARLCDFKNLSEVLKKPQK
jgi:8-oxo-dGTP pyrophosphatase MutT (NUDIX family)